MGRIIIANQDETSLLRRFFFMKPIRRRVTEWTCLTESLASSLGLLAGLSMPSRCVRTHTFFSKRKLKFPRAGVRIPSRISMNWLKELRKALSPPPREEREFVERCNNLTPRACQVLRLARDEAVRLGHDSVGTEHVLIGLMGLGQGVAVNVLARMNCDLEAVRSYIGKQVGRGPGADAVKDVTLSPHVKKIIEVASQEARALDHKFIGTEHLLLGLLRGGDGVAGNVLKGLGVNLEATRDQIIKELEPYFKDESDTPQ